MLKTSVNFLKTLPRYKSFVARSLNNLCPLIDIHPAVRDALKNGQPVVALESTIITHGMPYPHNLETAIEVETCVRDNGSVPATIGILDGRIKVGLTHEELERLSNAKPDRTIKCSRRDLPYVLSNKLDGGTTVAGTLVVAKMVGISVFATGGIGGVHRDGHVTFDVSADLIELGKSPVAVVSSGIKSILDIPRTMEYLETQGVLVASFQKPDRDFPAFYTRSSGVKAAYNFGSALEAAEAIHSLINLNLGSGVLIGVPIPVEHALDENLINVAINNALLEANRKNISGKEVTPFVLEAVSKITGGRSLAANKALIKNNASVASEISKQLSEINGKVAGNEEIKKIKNEGGQLRKQSALSQEIRENVPVVVGGSILDICLTLLEDDLKLDGATYKIKSKMYGGGVGRNIAEGIYKLHGDVHFISAVGNDEIGKRLLAYLPEHCTKGIKIVPDKTSSMCTVVFDKAGDCKLVLGDMKIHGAITPEQIMENEAFIAKAPITVMDSNIEVDTMMAILDLSKKHERPVFFEPTDMRIAGKPFKLPSHLIKQIKFISPNIYELHEIAKQLKCGDSFMQKDPVSNKNQEETLEMAKNLSSFVGNYIPNIILTLGHMGVFTAKFDRHYSNANFRFYNAPRVENIVNVSGAGDSFTSGFLTAMLAGKDEDTCILTGFHAAKCALQSESAVPESYKFDLNVKEANLVYKTL